MTVTRLWKVLIVALLLSTSTLACLLVRAGANRDIPHALVFPGANSRETYFSLHHVREAHTATRGAGVKVGILDHLFGTRLHPALYAGGQNFLGEDARWKLEDKDEHGYWLSLTLREIAPQAEVYALNTSSGHEAERVDAMVRAIDWAIAHRLDVLTYSNVAFSPSGRARLDPAVDRALAAGIVIVFIHYGHAGNLLPGSLVPGLEDSREPDVNVLPYDYSVVFVRDYARLQAGGTNGSYRPFLSMSSTAPVTAGVVAMLRSLRPGLPPAECREILRQSAYSTVFRGGTAPRVLDAAAAVRRLGTIASLPR